MTVTQDAVGRRVVLSPQEGLVAGGPAEDFEQRVQSLFRNGSTDLLVDLRGQVNVRLRGVISAKGGKLKTVFRTVPDVAVNKFILTMKGGNRGLLVNSQNLCAKKTRTGFVNLKAQNNRRKKVKKLRLNIPGCKGKKGKKKGKR